MDIIQEPKDTKARKEHKCNFCGYPILTKMIYNRATYVYSGEIYSWKTHKKCGDIASKLNMYDDCSEGLTGDDFCEIITGVFNDLAGWEPALPSFDVRLDAVIRHSNKETEA